MLVCWLWANFLNKIKQTLKIKVYGEQVKLNLGLLNSRINFKSEKTRKFDTYLEVIMSYSIWLVRQQNLLTQWPLPWTFTFTWQDTCF